MVGLWKLNEKLLISIKENSVAIVCIDMCCLVSICHELLVNGKLDFSSYWGGNVLSQHIFCCRKQRMTLMFLNQ